MDQQTDSSPFVVNEKELAVGVQFTCTVGNGRQITMQTGFPLEWGSAEVNKIVDKLADAMDRQALKYQLHDMELQLEQAEFQLRTNQQQQANFEQQQLAEWEKGPKRGPWKPTESQSKQIQNWRTTSEHLAADIIKRRKELEEVKARCR